MTEQPDPRRDALRRATIGWAIGFGVLVVAFIAVVIALNATVYSAGGFVRSYLDALNRHDAATARSLAGVTAPAGEATDLLVDQALGTISGIHQVSDATSSSGVHTVTVGYRLGSRAETSHFTVQADGTAFGLFPSWRFTTSPLATVSVTPLHDPRFRANGAAVGDGVENTAKPYVVFAPGLYVFDHSSTFLTSAKVSVPVSEPGSVTPVSVDVEADSRFVTEVRTQVHQYLTQCATQKVLLPTACPFGKSFNNRVISTPKWAIAKQPAISIVPDSDTKGWMVPDAVGQVHLTVKVQSLYDGTISTFDQDVPFTISYQIDIGAGNHLTITSLY